MTTSKHRSPLPVQAHKPQSHAVRIIGGQFKRSKLPVANKPGLRPTPDRVRETLFNWLGQDLSGWRCLDAFAGTGALGFEAASRGAREVCLVELDRTLVAQLQRNQAQLKAQAVSIQHTDGLGALRQQAPHSLDLVLLDPPFDSDLFAPALEAAVPALQSAGLIYLEAPLRWSDERLATLGLRLHRYLKAGAVHAHLLCREPAK
ncbi:MAG: 16S rRNA (guanine(966)-N(2))-methyltransferase RsmD [Rhodoferax sp.]|uniref:16S rRNA (guanine(966)-N(2))-methyltransferase RsmD n=1 Tax=Rhodoferax sp. TaxID=50421 RepID=UPI001B6486BA|nr:16S rRNA (guanine(966)-N(2))-methyltransferase RsmD [Rhodoferax sp.]MBP9905261.1 16S rRNA (guanine(966)-N(2))-methyltransferase RsmD [Rhodoferax sp.]